MGNYYLYRFAQFLAHRLPYKLSHAIVMCICDMHFYLSRTDRRIVENNLKVVTHQQEVDASQVRAVFRNFGEYLLEFFTMTKRLQPLFIKNNVHIENIEYLNEVLQKGKGAIIVSAHVGNWEMGGAILPLIGYPLSVVALAHKEARVNALFNAQREAFGAVVIQTDVAVRRVTEHLQQNRLVAILGDRDFGNKGLVMDFLGKPTMIPKGAVYFSFKTGAPIIPIFFIRTQNDHFQIRIYPSINPPHMGQVKFSDEVAGELIKKYLPAMEEEIKKHPSQWLLFREFWHHENSCCHTSA